MAYDIWDMVSAEAHANQNGITEGGLVMFAAADNSEPAMSGPDRAGIVTKISKDGYRVHEIIREKDVRPDYEVVLLSTFAPSIVEILENEDIEEQEEFDSLRWKLSTLSRLPDDILTMIFEIGWWAEWAGPQCTFATTVSHVTRRWRNLALANRRLWTRTWCSKNIILIACERNPEEPISEPYSEAEIDRFSTFLSRSMSMPVEIHLRYLHKNDLDGDEGAAFLQLILSHVGHCNHLNITGGDAWAMPTLMHRISTHSTPLLTSIQLGVDYDCHDYREAIRALPSLFDAPQLKMAQLDGVDYLPFLSSLPLHQITTLQLEGINGDDDAELSYLRKTLLVMKALEYLEMSVNWIGTQVMIPTVRTLKISLGDVSGFCAPLLTTLSMDRHPMEQLRPGIVLTSQFPSLKHLILNGLSLGVPKFDVVARSFPCIEQLTCSLDFSPTHLGTQFDISLVFDAIIGGSGAPNTFCWPKLHTLAVSALGKKTPLHSMKLYDTISVLQTAGHPICQLMLPKMGSWGMPHVPEVPSANEMAMAKLRTIIEVGELSLDRQTPFVRARLDPL
ncbi:hypothetical protein HWV62_38749 [Athelia sp. TMB]|nr:hypothetical protein HWV62_38749 [Athelia sp. TMB]